MMKLVMPSPEYAEDIRAFRQEFLDAGSSCDGQGALRRTPDPLEWIRLCEQFRHPETVPAPYVDATQFLYVREEDHRIVGMLQVRHRLNERLEKYDGHIGYSVRPSERRKGYAKSMLAAALPFCWQLGLDRVMISCLEGNEGSRRAILANGGTYENTVTDPETGERIERYWVEKNKK